jgi:hypothetical protein
MKILHEKRLNQRSHGKIFPTWAFLCVNDESLINVKVPQVMCCIMCYNRPIGHVILK